MAENEIPLKLAERKDADQIYGIMARVYEQLDDKSLFVCDDLQYVEEHIVKGLAVIACTENEKIVGSFIIRYPGRQSDNLGRDIHLDESELEHVAHLESAVVLPEYRGLSLQFKMLQYAEKNMDKDRYYHFLATVSPDNPASCRTFERAGYQIAVIKEKYGGLTRRIYYKNIKS